MTGQSTRGAALAISSALALAAGPALAAGEAAAHGPAIFGIPFDFVLFALTLLGVALFHHKTLQVGLSGLAVISLYKIFFTCFKTGPGFLG